VFKDLEVVKEYALPWCRHEIAEQQEKNPFEIYLKEEKSTLRPLPIGTMIVY